MVNNSPGKSKSTLGPALGAVLSCARRSERLLRRGGGGAQLTAPIGGGARAAPAIRWRGGPRDWPGAGDRAAARFTRPTFSSEQF